jgi:hypothetical protein
MGFCAKMVHDQRPNKFELNRKPGNLYFYFANILENCVYSISE